MASCLFLSRPQKLQFLPISKVEETPELYLGEPLDFHSGNVPSTHLTLIAAVAPDEAVSRKQELGLQSLQGISRTRVL